MKKHGKCCTEPIGKLRPNVAPSVRHVAQESIDRRPIRHVKPSLPKTAWEGVMRHPVSSGAAPRPEPSCLRKVSPQSFSRESPHQPTSNKSFKEVSIPQEQQRVASARVPPLPWLRFWRWPSPARRRLGGSRRPCHRPAANRDLLHQLVRFCVDNAYWRSWRYRRSYRPPISGMSATNFHDDKHRRPRAFSAICPWSAR